MSAFEDSWRKSSYSAGGADNCVECRTHESRVLIRDSRHPHHGHLTFPVPEWAAFLAGVRDREV